MTCMDADCQNLTGQIVGSPVIADGTYQAIKNDDTRVAWVQQEARITSITSILVNPFGLCRVDLIAVNGSRRGRSSFVSTAWVVLTPEKEGCGGLRRSPDLNCARSTAKSSLSASERAGLEIVDKSLLVAR